MKKPILTLIVLTNLIYGCDMDEKQIDLKTRLTEVNAAIDELIDESKAQSSDDCRTKLVGGGDNCSNPIFTYGVLDTGRLEALFTELGELKEELFLLGDGVTCDVEWTAPEKDSLINGVCKACHVLGLDENYECF